MGITDHLTCILRNLYVRQEKIARTRQNNGLVQNWEIHQGFILSPCLFNLYAEYIIPNASLDRAQAGIKIVGGNINNLRYADDTTLMDESEELMSLMMKVKEENKKAGLKLNIQKMKDLESSTII